jgi:predicted phosphodiesterase
MQQQSFTKADIARQYRSMYGAEMPAKKLGRIMFEDNRLLFKDAEEARNHLRYIAGKSGEANISKGITSSGFFEKEARPLNPYNLPKSDAETFDPFVMPFFEKVLIMNDVHLPYHDLPALTAAIDFGVANNPNAILLNGDILDIHKLSYFEKDPRKKNFSEELDIFKDFMSFLQNQFKCPIYYKFGNHEERYDKFLQEKAKELVGVEEFELENIIQKRADCIVIRDKRIIINNGLPYVHGHDFGRGVFSPVNAARGLFNQAKHSCVKGDCHTTSEHTEPDMFKKVITTYSVGALCGLTPKWLPLNKWNHGVAIQHNTAEGRYRLENRRIENGEIY